MTKTVWEAEGAPGGAGGVLTLGVGAVLGIIESLFRVRVQTAQADAAGNDKYVLDRGCPLQIRLKERLTMTNSS